MTDVLDPPRRQQTTPAQRLRTTMAAMRLSFMWFGIRKTLSTEQKAQAADTFDAAGEFLSAGKKLIDTKHPQFKAVTGVRNRALSYFKGISLPYPEPGIRLVRQHDIDAVHQQMETLKAELDEAVDKLDEHFDELKSAARRRLGRLYNATDYPSSLAGLFAMTWDFPSVEPPAYLQQLSPELYQQECARMQARFDEAVQMAEQAFFEELSKLVSHLTERLTGSDDGKPKIFRDTAVENLTEFFERFQAAQRSFERAARSARRACPGGRAGRRAAEAARQPATAKASRQRTVGGAVGARWPAWSIARGVTSCGGRSSEERHGSCY